MHRTSRIARRTIAAVVVLAASAATAVLAKAPNASAHECNQVGSLKFCGALINLTGRPMSYARYGYTGTHCYTLAPGASDGSVPTRQDCQEGRAPVSSGIVGGEASDDVDGFTVKSEGYHVRDTLGIFSLGGWHWRDKGVWTKFHGWSFAECHIGDANQIWCTMLPKMPNLDHAPVVFETIRPDWPAESTGATPSSPLPPSSPEPTRPPGSARVPVPALVEDGVFGPLTTEALQRALDSKYGAGLPITGVFGPRTKRALQGALGVSVDGVIGPNAIRALQAHVGAGVDGVWGHDTTRHLQMALNADQF
jgi:hypothetical protein